MNKTTIGGIVLLAYAGTVLAANWLITHIGGPDGVPVGFGYTAPAGVYAAGLTFTLRDIGHRLLGRWPTLAAMTAGVALSYWAADGRVATASAAAFGVSELADLLVYERLRSRFVAAVAASNAAGLVVDSALFLWIAFSSLQFLPGQLIGKAWTTAAVLPLVWWLRRAADPQPAVGAA